MRIQKTHDAKHGLAPVLRPFILVSTVTVVGFVWPTLAWSQTNEWTVYNTTNSGLPYNGVSGLAIDKQGNIWAGTGRWFAFAGGGLAKYDGQNWTVYNTANSQLPSNDHTGLSVDAQGNIWIGTEGGTLMKFDGENWTNYGRLTSAGQLASASFDAQGNVWVGTFGGGLTKFDGEHWTVYTTGNSGLRHDRAWATAIDAQGNIWIGTAGGGVAKFDGVDNWTVYTTSNSGLPHNDAAILAGSLAIDTQGNIWIGTSGGGLAKFDGVDKWTVYNTSNSGLPNINAAGALAVDSQDNIWVGTWGGGLARFDGENWIVYDTSNSGLPNNRIYSLAIDAQNNVWIGTENGLAVYRPQPVIDFNGDGTVSIKDLIRLIESWGQDDQVVDIAPPFGDGMVDVLDLELLMGHWDQEVDDPTLKACWKLDETEGHVAYDSAAENDAAVAGDALWKSMQGQIGGALLLDGTDDHIETPFALNPAQKVFSAFAWIKGGIPGQSILSQAGMSNWLLSDPQSGCLKTEIRGAGRHSGALTSTTLIADDLWHRVGLVWDGTNRILYVDDVEVARDTQPALKGSSRDLYIGTAHNLKAGTFWAGLIDDIRIYDRVVVP